MVEVEREEVLREIQIASERLEGEVVKIEGTWSGVQVGLCEAEKEEEEEGGIEVG